MKILVAPDKFKGSLTARQAAEAIARGLSGVLRDGDIRCLPVADGGEGTAEAICDALAGQWVSLAVRNPIGATINARYAWIAPDATAVIEMSEAAGLHRVAASQRDALRSSTFGVGQMIRDAVARGARKILVGLGGSATNDGGIGMAAALGFEFLTSDGGELEPIPANLLALTRITAPERGEWLRLAAENNQPSQGVTIVAACDVRNPLLGERGATRVYGPQKGADAKTLDLLEQGLKNLADVVTDEFGVDFRDTPGAGAAGGLGFGLMSFCGATIRPGFELVSEVLKLEAAIADSDIVITGEGRLDTQTLEGKTATGIAALARKHQKRVIAIAGSIEEHASLIGCFDAAHSLVGEDVSLEEALREPAVHLQACAARVARTLLREKKTSLKPN